jgi:hypothetical protein
LRNSVANRQEHTLKQTDRNASEQSHEPSSKKTADVSLARLHSTSRHVYEKAVTRQVMKRDALVDLTAYRRGEKRPGGVIAGQS